MGKLGKWQDKPNLYPLKKSNLLNPREADYFYDGDGLEPLIKIQRE